MTPRSQSSFKGLASQQTKKLIIFCLRGVNETAKSKIRTFDTKISSKSKPFPNVNKGLMDGSILRKKLRVKILFSCLLRLHKLVHCAYSLFLLNNSGDIF